MSKYKNMKIRTYGSEELSTAIQKKLFELGYGWNASGREVLPINCYTGDLISAWKEGWVSRNAAFEVGTFPEVTIDELMQMKPEKRETIKIGEAVYDKAEFEEATKHLKPIED